MGSPWLRMKKAFVYPGLKVYRPLSTGLPRRYTTWISMSFQTNYRPTSASWPLCTIQHVGWRARTRWRTREPGLRLAWRVEALPCLPPAINAEGSILLSAPAVCHMGVVLVLALAFSGTHVAAFRVLFCLTRNQQMIVTGFGTQRWLVVVGCASRAFAEHAAMDGRRVPAAECRNSCQSNQDPEVNQTFSHSALLP